MCFNAVYGKTDYDKTHKVFTIFTFILENIPDTREADHEKWKGPELL